MNQLHTWSGVIIGALLFAIFWMGTLSVFDREIDRWMAPMSRLALPEKTASFEAFRSTYNDAVAEKARSWTVLQPTERQPVFRIVYRDASNTILNRYFHPATGAELPDRETLGGTRFLYPFHYHLHLRAWDIGEWIVGVAAMTMLLLCVSGIFIHRKIFADFFTLRPDKQSLRLVLDVHTLAGVLGLPFYVAITLSGLIYSFAFYFPSGLHSSYANRQAFAADAVSNYDRPKLNRPGELASLDEMSEQARKLWGGKEPWAIVVKHPGDAGAFVSIFQSFDTSIVRHAPLANFDAGTGQLVHASRDLKPIMTAQRFIGGMHQIQFKHWTLRWLYFGLGLLGCALIATGFLFWLESRRKKHNQLGLPGVRIVEGVAVGSTTGIIIATLAFFVANRLLPLGTTFLGAERAALEIWVFYLVWIAAFAHAWLRRCSAVWTEQCWAVAALAFAAVALNWITTGDHLARSLAQPYLWPVAGMDVLLLVGAAAAALMALRLQRRLPAPGYSAVAAAGMHAAE
jgi:uncharacterized iron-regulated membrane protein